MRCVQYVVPVHMHSSMAHLMCSCVHDGGQSFHRLITSMVAYLVGSHITWVYSSCVLSHCALLHHLQGCRHAWARDDANVRNCMKICIYLYSFVPLVKWLNRLDSLIQCRAPFIWNQLPPSMCLSSSSHPLSQEVAEMLQCCL